MAVDVSFLKWIEHAGFLIEINGKHVYIDPFRIRDEALPKADIVFITHSHYDHLDEEALGKIVAGKTQFVAPKETAGKLSGKRVLAVEPNKDYEIEGIKFSTVPAYNIGKEFHPRANGWVGYVIDANGTRLYHAGDTDATEEMKSVEADIALIPVGGTYTMNLDEAVRAAERMKAKSFVPMHYKLFLGVEGSKKAEAEFKKRVKSSLMLKQIQEPYYSEAG